MTIIATKIRTVIILTAVLILLAAPAWAEYHGNQNSLVFHGPGCKDYNCTNCVVNFPSAEDAAKAGFRPHKSCVSGAAPAAAAPGGKKATQTYHHLNGNNYNDSFNKAKRMLERQVYYDYRVTIYCSASFDGNGNITLPQGFTTTAHQSRASRIEWEHIVPAENFGRAFIEWREGDPLCTDNKGASFRGRKCAEKVNMEYRYMQSDMHNLYPAIGCVNAMRQNYNFTLLPGAESSFGTCQMKIYEKKVEPPEHSRGVIARTYKYMEWAYTRYNMSDQQKKLMDAWDNMYPADQWECTRAGRIKDIQGNENPFVTASCLRG